MKNNERGSITLFVLISMIFFLTIAMTAYASATAKLQGQTAETERIKQSYKQDLSPEGLATLYSSIVETNGDGTEQNPYKIYTIEDLLRFSNKVNAGDNYSGKYVELMNVLDFNENNSYKNAERTDFGDINGNGQTESLKTELTTGSGWIPIGNQSTPFSGFFNGNDNLINNLYINTNKNNQGLFGRNIGTIQNVTVKGSVKANRWVAGISGHNAKPGVIRNCTNYATIEGTNTEDCQQAGGIAGTNESNIYNCNNYGEIVSNTLTKKGGLQIGGICGYSYGNIEECCNYGKVTGNVDTSHVGGIVGNAGYNANIATIKKCYNYGEVEGYQNVGGIVGNLDGEGSSITLCENDEKILTRSYNGGGIAGAISINNEISKCINNAEITTTGGNGGGIVGVNSGFISLSVNKGKIMGNNEATGGIAGYQYNNINAKIMNCYNLNEINCINAGRNIRKW